MGALGPWLAWVEQTSLAVALREHPWLYPAVEIGHILSFAVLIGAAAMFDLRLLGVSRGVSVNGLARHLLPWARIGLGIAAPTGVLLLIPDATAIASNRAFQVKLVLIALAILNAGVFHRWTARSIATWDVAGPTPLGARLAGIVSLVLWAGVVTCGRLIAYV
jgi:hypothetical protein